MDRKNKPSSLSVTSSSTTIAQPTIDLKDNILTATLPSGDSVTINLYGATVTSWKTSPGSKEQLFLSSAAVLNGTKPIRGGIPLVFPVFGPPPKDHQTGQLPQHGFARNNNWEFLGKSSSESLGKKADDSLKLDFGLSADMLDEATRQKWPLSFGLVYSVTLSKGKLGCQMHVQNNGEESFEFQCLFHTYLAVKDISKTTVSGLNKTPYVDKVRSAKTFTETSTSIPIASEVDRVYTPASVDSDTIVNESNQPSFVITRDGLPDVTVWNGWEDKIKGMGDFEPKDGYKRYLCIEPGYVSGWVKLEGGDAWQGGCGFESKL